MNSVLKALEFLMLNLKQSTFKIPGRSPLLLLGLIFMSACSAKRKHHRIPYEQMPLIVSKDAPAETHALVAEYKQGYQVTHYNKFLDRITQLEYKNFTAQKQTTPEQQNSNKKHVVENKNSIEFASDFLNALKTNNLKIFKESLDAFILENVEKSKAELLYSLSANSAFNPLLTKTANAYSLTNLLTLAWTRKHSQKDMRNQRLVVIFTPNNMSLGYTVEDAEQGWLLFGISSTAKGSKDKYYGPTRFIKGSIAIVDLESYIILKALSHELDNVAEARNFAMDHSAKAFRYDRNKVNSDFKKGENLNVFELSGDTVEKLPADGSKYVDTDTTYGFSFSDLNEDGLKNSYRQHKEAVRRAELQQRILAVGENHNLEGQWLYSFGGQNVIKTFIHDLLINSPLSPAAKVKVEFLKRDRDCYVENLSTLSFETRASLKSWGLFGSGDVWHFENIASDDLGLCRALLPLGSHSESGFIKKNTRILQPVYIFIPANPEDLDANTFEAKKSEIRNSQLSDFKNVEIKFCEHLGMKSLSAQNELTETLEIRALWKELFYSDAQSVEQKHAELLKDHNAFEIRCVVNPVYIAPPPPPAAPAEDEDDDDDDDDQKPTPVSPENLPRVIR